MTKLVRLGLGDELSTEHHRATSSALQVIPHQTLDIHAQKHKGKDAANEWSSMLMWPCGVFNVCVTSWLHHSFLTFIFCILHNTAADSINVLPQCIDSCFFPCIATGPTARSMALQHVDAPHTALAV
jgi:hypothetical protein